MNNSECQNLKLSVQIKKPHLSKKYILSEKYAILEALEKKRTFEPYSKNSLIVSHLERLGLRQKAINFEMCGELVTKYKCENCGHIEYVNRSSCNLRICKRCSRKLYKKLWKKYVDTIKLMKRPKLLTLTFGFTPMLYPEVISEFRKMFSKLRKRFKTIKGGIYVFEVKRSPRKVECIEVHIHALIDSVYIPQKEISEAWFEISGRFIVDIRKAYSCKKGLGYILKYVSKPPEFPLARDYASYEFMFNKRRRVQGFGSCYNVKTSLVIMEITCSFCGSKMLKIEETSCWILEHKLRDMLKTGDG